jgi:CTP:molybdopterin cytidylyltransferase MocA
MMLMMMTKVDIQVISMWHQMRVRIIQSTNMMMGFSTSFANTVSMEWNWIDIAMMLMMMTKMNIQVISMWHQMRVCVVQASNMMMGFSASFAKTVSMVRNWIDIVMMMVMAKVDIQVISVWY